MHTYVYILYKLKYFTNQMYGTLTYIAKYQNHKMMMETVADTEIKISGHGDCTQNTQDFSPIIVSEH